MFECQICKEKDKRIQFLEDEIFVLRTEKNRLLDEILKHPIKTEQPVPENNEFEDIKAPGKLPWPQRRRLLEEADRQKAENLRAEALARKQMQELIDESRIPQQADGHYEEIKES